MIKKIILTLTLVACTLRAVDELTPAQAAAFIPARTKFSVPGCGSYTNRLADFVSDIRYINILNSFVGGLKQIIDGFLDRINLLQAQMSVAQANIGIIQSTLEDRIKKVNEIQNDIRRIRTNSFSAFVYANTLLCNAQAAATGVLLVAKMAQDCPTGTDDATRCPVKQSHYGMLLKMLDQSNACGLCAHILPTVQAADISGCDCACTGKGLTAFQCLQSLSDGCKAACCGAQTFNDYTSMQANILGGKFDIGDNLANGIPRKMLTGWIDKFGAASNMDFVKKAIAGIDRTKFEADRIAQHTATANQILQEVDELKATLQNNLDLIAVEPGKEPSPVYLPNKITAVVLKIKFAQAIIDQVSSMIKKTKDAITAVPNDDPMYKECPQNVQDQLNVPTDTSPAYVALDQVRLAMNQKYGV